MMILTIFDYIALGTIILFICLSMMHGLVAEVVALLRWVVAFLLARLFYFPVSLILIQYIQPDVLATVLAFVVIFIIVFLIMYILKSVLTSLVKAIGLSGINRLCGAFFGFLKGILLLTLFVMGAQMTKLPQEKMWQESISIPYFKRIAQLATPYLPERIQQNINQ